MKPLALPGVERGSAAVLKGKAVTWKAGGQLRVRIVRPEGSGPFPLVVFSHGFASDVDQYDCVFEHWASHGYVVIAPYHRDGGGTLRGIFNSIRLGNMGLIAARVADMKLVLDRLAQLDAVEPGLAARIDASRIAVGGHSFGAFTAQQFGGAAAVDPKSGARVEGRDPRVRAIVALSPPGEMFGVINATSWLDMDQPMLATTGTQDMDGRFVKDWRQHRLSFDSARTGHNWLLVIEGANHYLGNLICRTDRKEPAQLDALRLVNAATVTFLDAFVRDGATARAWLDQPDIATASAGLATLAHR